MKHVDYLIYNGELHPSNKLFISPDNRSFRYGDGLFETMKMINSNIILQEFHFERLFSSLQIMQFDVPDYLTAGYLQQQIQQLAAKNTHQQLARIRLTLFRGDGGLYDTENNQPNYLIQTWALDEAPVYNEKGLNIDIYKDAHKTVDTFSAIKHNNYLPYAMAALWSKKQSLDDALVLNCYGNITEAATSNVFIVKHDIIQTPPLSEGCINGVVRRYLVQQIQQQERLYKETVLTIENLLEADEVFVTNAGFYIRWIKRCGERIYRNDVSKKLFNEVIIPLISND